MFIDDIKNGNVPAFEAFYKQWNQKVYHYTYKKCQSTYLSEEVVQQVFIRIWNKRGKLRLDIPIEAQLFRITRNILIDELRKQALLRHVEYQLCQSEEPAYHSTGLEEKEALANIYLAIDKMPRMRKLVFMMSRFQYLSYIEIAERLSISPRTVENHIVSALKVLRKYLPLISTLFFSC